MANGHTLLIATKEMEGLMRRVADRLGSGYHCMTLDEQVFASGEMIVSVPESVREMRGYLFHSLQLPTPNDAYARLFMTLNALQHASIGRVDLMLPFMSYLRQDKKDGKREPITAGMWATLTEEFKNVNHIYTMDMHSPQAQGFYRRIQVDDVPGIAVQKTHLKELLGEELTEAVIVSPDVGGLKRAKRAAKSLGVSLVGSIEKYRTAPNTAEAGNYIGPSVEERTVLLYDDMIDTGGSIVLGADKLRDLKARRVIVCATHPVLSPHKGVAAEQRLRDADLEVIVTESIPRSAEWAAANPHITVLPIDALYAQIITEAQKVGGSISSLYL